MISTPSPVRRGALRTAALGAVAALVTRQTQASEYRSSPAWQAYEAASQCGRPAGRLASPAARRSGLATLIGVRNILRQRNLYDTDAAARRRASRAAAAVGPELPRRALARRLLQRSRATRDGPRRLALRPQRAARARPSASPPRRAPAPNPRTVSRELMTRHEFQAATALNALVAAWLQFMIQDWFSHGSGPEDDRLGGPARRRRPVAEQRPMIIPRTPADPTRPPDSPGPPTYLNTETHWWDGSQLYGTNREMRRRRAARGPTASSASAPTAGSTCPTTRGSTRPTVPGWWLGLSIMGRSSSSSSTTRSATA